MRTSAIKTPSALVEPKDTWAKKDYLNAIQTAFGEDTEAVILRSLRAAYGVFRQRATYQPSPEVVAKKTHEKAERLRAELAKVEAAEKVAKSQLKAVKSA